MCEGWWDGHWHALLRNHQFNRVFKALRARTPYYMSHTTSHTRPTPYPSHTRHARTTPPDVAAGGEVYTLRSARSARLMVPGLEQGLKYRGLQPGMVLIFLLNRHAAISACSLSTNMTRSYHAYGLIPDY